MRRGGGGSAQVSPPGYTSLVDELAAARIGGTHNQYAGSELRRRRLRDYLASRADAPILLVGEAAGYRGASVSGIAFTSERQLTGAGPAEASATIVHRVLAELGLEEQVLLWNLVPTHPGTATSNRAPNRAEIRAAGPFLDPLAEGRRVVPVGRLAHAELGGDYVRHPAHGGAAAFRAGLLRFSAGAPGARRFHA
jgi:uracil-DNA glycosylase